VRQGKDRSQSADPTSTKEQQMKRASRGTRLAGVLLAAVVAAPVVATTATAADYPAGESINPAALGKGPATPLLRLVDHTIVDGRTQVVVTGASHVSMVGRSGEDYLVMTSDENHENWRLQRVTAAGEQSTVAGGPSAQPVATLAAGGAHVALEGYQRRGILLRVLDTHTGEVVGRRESGYVSVLDFGERRMVVGQWENGTTPSRTFWWNPFNGKVAKIADKAGYIADIDADRVGVFTADPYLGGCQKVMTLSTPRRTLWRSCDDLVMAFSPTAKRMVTSYILNDGPGPGLVQVRGAHGRLLDTYRARWFGTMHWETDERLLLQVGTKQSVAMTRCTLRACERISRLYRTDGRDPWSVMPVWDFADESLLDR
jgi:hypothetical protein